MWKTILNEFIGFITQSITDVIVEWVKKAKDYVVIMDCTPKFSSVEQLSVVLCIVSNP